MTGRWGVHVFAATGLMILPSLSHAEESYPELPRKAAILSSILPRADFRFGQTDEEIQKITRLKYPNWGVRSHERATNNRDDPGLPPEAKAPYRRQTAVWDQTEGRAFERVHRFSLTSPLSGSVVYSVSLEIKGAKWSSRLLTTHEWMRGLREQWGKPHVLVEEYDHYRVAYFFGADGKLLSDPGDTCWDLYPLMDDLDKKTETEVQTLIRLIEETGCFFSFDNKVYFQRNGVIERSVIYFQDDMRHARDVLKRVTFGVKK
ncbi:hypothetical protein [Neorhizobium tomejilense]|uniref:hypothetical protein n=1 Tax=Neorhizobium tomejilense TaxID=2093828 RepID=UPI000CF9197B|nr:hypothetical protein [Neorhizobium tomejilense]